MGSLARDAAAQCGVPARARRSAGKAGPSGSPRVAPACRPWLSATSGRADPRSTGRGRPRTMSDTTASVATVRRDSALAPVDREAEAREWLARLRSRGAEREEAAAKLHALLVRAAHFELGGRRAMLGEAQRDTVEGLALQSADDALAA